MTENSVPAEDVPAEVGDSFTTADGQADSSDVLNVDVAKMVEFDDDLIVGQVLEAVISSPDLNATSPTTTTHLVEEMSPANETDQQQAQVEMMEVVEDKEPQQEGEQEAKAPSDDKVEAIEVEEEEVNEKEVDENEVDEREAGEREAEENKVDDIEIDEKEENGDDEVQEIDMIPLEEEPEYIIERVVDKKLNHEGKPLWLVKWQNYSSKRNTWEPLEHLVECDNLVQEFEMARAKMVAERYDEENAKNAMGQGTHQTGPRRRPMMPRHRDFEILDVMGLTKVDGEKYFLVTIENSTKKGFIRESIANRVIPSKVIDFYIKNLQWKAVSSPEAKNV